MKDAYGGSFGFHRANSSEGSLISLYSKPLRPDCLEKTIMEIWEEALQEESR